MDNKPETLDSRLDRLAWFEPIALPVVSLYLNLQPDHRGRDHYQPFVRKELRARAKTFAPRSPERESFDRDIERIEEYLRDQILPESNGAAIFACSGREDFFDALQLAAAIEQNSIHVGRQPHLYPLARISDRYRRYACLVADTNAARIYVFGAGERLATGEVANEKTKRFQAGGWSQSRYQRHVDHQRMQHIKEVVDSLSKIVHSEHVERIFLAGDEVVLPKIREQLTPDLRSLIPDELRLDIKTPENEIFQETLEAAREDREIGVERKVARLLDEYRAGGLGVIGARDTLVALIAGQVNDLIISSDPNSVVDDLEPEEGGILASDTPVTDLMNESHQNPKIAEALILKARQTGADITFVDNPELLADTGGAGALLRFRVDNA